MLKACLKHVACLGVATLVSGVMGVVHAGTVAAPSLGEVVVTAERFPTGEKESSRFVTLYSSEELKETGAGNLVEALRRKGGFSYKSFGPLGVSHGGMNSELTVRGIKKGILILVNGSPVQGAAGQGYDLDMIPLEQIERVEVMKGAASTLYGADAMAGVVNVITKKNAAASQTFVSVEAGSHGYRTMSAGVTDAKVNLGLAYTHLDDLDRISHKTYANTPGKNCIYARDAVDNVGMSLNATLADGLYVDYLGSFSSTGYKNILDSGKLLKGTRQDHTKHFADLRFEKADCKLKAFGYHDLMERDEYTKNPISEDRNKNFNYGLQGDYRVNLGGVELATGADYIYRGADYNNNLVTKYGKHHRDDYSVYMQAKKEFFGALTAVVGFREQLIDGDCDNKDYDIFLPSAGLNYRVTGGLNLFANAGKAFKAPSFNDLYYKGDALTGNPDLDPESGWTYEGGIKYDNDCMKLRLAGFFMTYEDKIETMPVDGVTTKINAGDYESKGVEWESAFYPFANRALALEPLSLDLAGCWVDATAEDTEGEEYQAAPKFQTSVGASYVTEPVVLNLNCEILRNRDRNLANYNPVNFAGKVKCYKGYLTFGVDNMFDETVVTYGEMRDDKPKHYEYYDLERTFKVGYEMRF